MRVVYVYIGILPEYILHTVYQTRLFFKGPIDIIVSDLQSPYLSQLAPWDVTIIPYESVRHPEWEACLRTHGHKFSILTGLDGRERLFIYAFERFFVLYQWFQHHPDAEHVLFLELDNLIYDDPTHWEEAFCMRDMAYMFDHYDRCASGICFIKNRDILYEFTRCCLDYVSETDVTKHFMTEMQALDACWKKIPHRIQILPTHWPSASVPFMTYEHYSQYESLFDAAAIGIYLGGVDPFHTDGLIRTGLRSIWSLIDYTSYSFEWKEDTEGRNIPYVHHDGKWIRINNLHIHSKNLGPYLSIIRNQM